MPRVSLPVRVSTSHTTGTEKAVLYSRQENPKYAISATLLAATNLVLRKYHKLKAFVLYVGTVGGLPCKVGRGVLFFVRGTRKQEV